MFGGLFEDIRYEKPDWVLRGQAWVDLADPVDGYDGPLLLNRGKLRRPIYVPITISFHGAHDHQWARLEEETVKKMTLEEVPPVVHQSIAAAFDRMDVPISPDISLVRVIEYPVSYQEFVVQSAGQRVADSHNCTPTIFSLKLQGDPVLAFQVSYESATVYLGTGTR